jgi:hypothetical protein
MKILAAATVLALTTLLASAPAQAAPIFNFQFTPGTTLQAQQGFIEAGARWSSLLTDNITVNLTVGFGALGGGILGQAASTQDFHSYASFRSALEADRSSALDNTAVAHLPATSFGMLINRTANNPHGAASATPYLDNNGSDNNSTVFITNAEAKALGRRSCQTPCPAASAIATVLSSSTATWPSISTAATASAPRSTTLSAWQRTRSATRWALSAAWTCSTSTHLPTTAPSTTTNSPTCPVWTCSAIRR